MKNFIFFIGVLTVLILIGGVLISNVKTNPAQDVESLSPPTSYEYFWSKTCPHCAKVAEFMDGWEGKDKIQMNKFEVNESRENAIKFYERGTFCKIPKNELGVPLLITPEGKCLIGDAAIIEHLKGLDI